MTAQQAIKYQAWTLGWMTVMLVALACQRETASGDSGESVPPCVEESECLYLGPGSMCMEGMCMTMDTLGPPVQSAPVSVDLPELHRLSDLDPDPDRFEGRLAAQDVLTSFFPGQSAMTYAYVDGSNGQSGIPGPLIEVDVGSEIVVHFTNQLREPTSIHWHGVRLPPHMDGVPEMPVPAIAPGETYTYRFTALDPGLYWYHPHVRTDEQAERGLYGVIVVRGEEPLVTKERILVLDDILLLADGSIAPRETGPAHIVENGQMSMRFSSMMGRQGNYLLVNGVAQPWIDVQAGTVERWRLVNTANSRFFNLEVPGHRFTVIGSDGGLIDEPYESERLLIGSAERLDVLVRMVAPPSTILQAVNVHHDRGHEMADPGRLPLFEMRYAASPSVNEVDPVVPRPSRVALRDGEPVKTLVFGEVLNDRGRVEFTFNDQTWPDVDFVQAKPGSQEVWELRNDTHMDHPFHLHGHFFEVKALRAGLGTWTPFDRVERKDTVIVPAQTAMRIAVDYSGFRGEWAFHCHILEHAEAGMMGMLALEDDVRRCVPGQPVCDDGVLRVCSASGLALEGGRPCASGCEGRQDGSGQCRPHCTPLASRCVGRDLQMCDAHGDAWSPLELCPTKCVGDGDDRAHCE
jgi:FtsP/CotA-like multicopper oxidase with cupredoxin domain